MVAIAIAGVIVAPADAKPKKSRDVVTRYFMNWGGACDGAGYLALKHVPNAESCALFFPELGNSHYFRGVQGLPLALDATKPVSVHFDLATVAHAAAEFEVAVTAAVGGKQVDLGSGIVSVTAAGPGDTPVHLDIEPPAGLNGAKITEVNLTVTWTDGVTYSSMDLDSGTATLTLHGSK